MNRLPENYLFKFGVTLVAPKLMLFVPAFLLIESQHVDIPMFDKVVCSVQMQSGVQFGWSKNSLVQTFLSRKAMRPAKATPCPELNTQTLHVCHICLHCGS